MRRTFAGVVLLIGLVAAGCGGGSGGNAKVPPAGDGALHGAKADQLKVVSEGDLTAADLGVAPKGDVVLSVAGKIGTTNNGDRIDLDIATIERLDLVDLTAYEPFEKRSITFRGVWLQDLLAVAGADKDAKTIRLHALDDYEVTFTPEQLKAGGALLATMTDGERMGVSKAGPTRIVFSDGDAIGENKDLWIWSLDKITVE